VNVSIRVAIGLVVPTVFVLIFWIPKNDPPRRDRLTPEIVTLVEGPFSEEELEVNLMLFNDTYQGVTLTEASATCGCTSLVTIGMQTLTAPMLVPAGTSQPWRAKIKTEGQAGNKRINVSLKVERNGVIEILSSQIQFNVRLPWRAVPPALYFNAGFKSKKAGLQKTNFTIDIVEDAALPPVQISEVRSSNSRVMTATLSPQMAAPQMAAPQQDVSRHQVLLSLDDEQFGNSVEMRELVTVVPNGASRHQPLLIPVTIIGTKGEFAIVPDRLVLTASSGSSTRTVVIRSRVEIQGTLRVAGIPEHVSVNVIKSKPDLHQLTFEFDALSLIEDCTLTVIASEKGTVIGHIPIRIIH